MGFGTGLNALLTLLESDRDKRKIFYHSVELHPLTLPQVNSLNYPEYLGIPKETYTQLHQTNWGKPIDISDSFTLLKENGDLALLPLNRQYHIIYHDAFAPDIQPELWSRELFRKYYEHLEFGGILVTYSVKGEVKRNLVGAGFRIEKLPGPTGKREICRAYKEPCK